MAQFLGQHRALFFQFRLFGVGKLAHPRIGRQGERRAHLHARSAERERLVELARRAIPAGQPERQSERRQLGEIDAIPLAAGLFVGGLIGPAIVRTLPPGIFRRAVVVCGFGVAALLALRALG